ncbi:MAG TPA: hypothetical protein ENJ52_02995 [Aliiroseovarius sp.]|nr:hypothetical protein [Aliiroseovarius sp.]
MQEAAQHDTTPEKPPALWPLPGFHGKARVATIFGDLPVEALRRRDELKTRAGPYLRVEWVDKIHLDDGFLRSCPDANPVLITANALRRGLPARPMMLSPDQALFLPEPGMQTRARPARDLAKARHGISRWPVSGITYFVFHCGKPAEVSVEGIWCATAP